MNRMLHLSISFAFAVFLSGNSVLHASIITITSFDANLSGSSGFTVTPSLAGDPTTYSFTRTANLDGGTINDTLSFDFVYTMYTGSTFDGTNVTLGTSVALVDFSNPHYMNNYVDDVSGASTTNNVTVGDSFRVSITNISYSSGEGFTNPGVSFNGFNSISKFGNGDADIYVGTTSAATKAVPTTNGAITLDGVTDLVVTTALTTGTSNQRWRDLNFSFTVPDSAAVPEPSSVLILLIGSVVCLVRRRACR